jgi:hypothetical protein
MPPRRFVVALVLSALGASAVPAAPLDPPAAVPVVREARYKMSAAVRPLLIFWIRASNVGGARIL